MTSDDDWIFTQEHFDKLAEDLSPAKQREYRSKSIWFMEDLAKVLNIHRKVLSTACIYFHRFFMYHSFRTQNRFSIAVACLFLAAKVEDRPIKLRDLYNAFTAVHKKANEPDVQKKILLSERILLNTLTFDLNVAHPYFICSTKIREFKGLLSEESSIALNQACVNFINDCYRSTLYIRYKVHEVGLSCLFLATIYLGLKPQCSNSSSKSVTSWLEILAKDVEERTIRDICLEILEMYNNNAYYLKLENKSGLRQLAYSELGVSYFVDESTTVVSSSPKKMEDTELDGGENQVWQDDADGDERDDEFNEEDPQTVRNIKVSRVFQDRVKTTEQSSANAVSPVSSFETPIQLPPPPPSTETPSAANDTEYSYDGEDSTPFVQQSRASETPNSPDAFQDLPSLKFRERSISIGDESVNNDNKRSRVE